MAGWMVRDLFKPSCMTMFSHSFFKVMRENLKNTRVRFSVSKLWAKHGKGSEDRQVWSTEKQITDSSSGYRHKCHQVCEVLMSAQPDSSSCYSGMLCGGNTQCGLSGESRICGFFPLIKCKCTLMDTVQVVAHLHLMINAMLLTIISDILQCLEYDGFLNIIIKEL